MTQPKQYSGFTENAYRLMFPYEDHFAPHHPFLQTVLPSGVIEQEKYRKPEIGKGILAYPYPQTALHPATAYSLTNSLAIIARKGSPFVWERNDGSLAVMQVWPTDYNDKFREDFKISTENPDPTIFSPQAVSEFQRTIQTLFGPTTDGSTIPIMYCHRAAVNTMPVYVGTRDQLLLFLATNLTIQHHYMNIQTISRTGFTAGTIDGKGKTGSKQFTMAEEGEYALYVKSGWMTMACCTPIEQFLQDRVLHE